MISVHIADLFLALSTHVAHWLTSYAYQVQDLFLNF